MEQIRQADEYGNLIVSGTQAKAVQRSVGFEWEGLPFLLKCGADVSINVQLAGDKAPLVIPFTKGLNHERVVNVIGTGDPGDNAVAVIAIR